MLVLRCFSMDYDLIPHGSQRSVVVGLPSLKNRRRVAARVVMYKIISNKLSTNPTEFLERSVSVKLKSLL